MKIILGIGGSGLKIIATATGDVDFPVIGVDFRFHNIISLRPVVIGRPVIGCEILLVTCIAGKCVTRWAGICILGGAKPRILC